MGDNRILLCWDLTVHRSLKSLEYTTERKGRTEKVIPSDPSRSVENHKQFNRWRVTDSDNGIS